MDNFIEFAKLASDKPLSEDYLKLSSIYERYFKCKDVLRRFTFRLGKYKHLIDEYDNPPIHIMSMGMLSITMNIDDCEDVSLLCFEISEIITNHIPNIKYAYIPGLSIFLMYLIDNEYIHEAMLLLSVAGGSKSIEKYVDESWSPLGAVCTFNGPLNIVQKDANKLRNLAIMTKEKEIKDKEIIRNRT